MTDRVEVKAQWGRVQEEVTRAIDMTMDLLEEEAKAPLTVADLVMGELYVIQVHRNDWGFDVAVWDGRFFVSKGGIGVHTAEDVESIAAVPKMVPLLSEERKRIEN